jgi:peptide deformylase
VAAQGTRGVARPIRLFGDPVLRTPTDEVIDFDESLARLVDDMFASMYAAEGVGLAANQIGVGLSVFV